MRLIGLWVGQDMYGFPKRKVSLRLLRRLWFKPAMIRLDAHTCRQPKAGYPVCGVEIAFWRREIV